MSQASREREKARRTKPRNPTWYEISLGARPLSESEWIELRAWQRAEVLKLQSEETLDELYRIENSTNHSLGQPAIYPEPNE